ncbi:DUF4091 domain-containing protein [Marinilabiliaceae bacterium JC017]|nr:DUF4091 domain-containing protein [Marinilabiliaceae bacterium JC017]
MNKYLLSVLLVVSLVGCVPKRPPVDCSTYEEPKDPKPGDAVQWQAVGRGLHVSFGSKDLRYSKTAVPFESVVKEQELTAWRGEQVSTQVVMWSVDSVCQVECEVMPFTTANNKSLPAESIQARFVRYVLTDEFAGGCGYRQAKDFDSSLVADALDPIKGMHMSPATVRPVWITVKVPQDARPGLYKGSLKVYSHKNPVQELRLNIRVLDRVLPSSDQWAFHLDLWQNPFAIARWHQVEPWSEDHFNMMRPYMEMLAQAGQKCITTSIIHHPWNSQTYDPFLSMIKWTRKTNGHWEYDFSVFDEWVRFAKNCGIEEQINCYTMVPWGNKFTYFDARQKKEVTLQAEPGTKEYEKLWGPFISKFADHLRENGWFEETTIAMDERPREAMVAVIKLIKRIEPDFKIALAANHWIPEIMDDIYDLCVASEFKYPRDMKQKRKADGKPTTYYTCCSENYPNTFTFSPPAEASWLGWYAAALDLDGYLRWAYNSWVEKPRTDSRFRAWPAGDTYFVYPGPMSSIRFERLIEGIQDYEKIRILRDELKEANTPEAGEKLKLLENALNGYKIDVIPVESAAKMVNQGQELLLELSK